MADLERAVADAEPGDVIVVKDGTYSSAGEIRLDGEGTALRPITIVAESVNGVIFTGNSRVRLSGPYLTLSGMRFEDGVLDALSGAASVVHFDPDCLGCRLTESIIDGYGAVQTGDAGSYPWIRLYGRRNRVDHNMLADKTHPGAMVQVMRSESNSGTTSDHRIDHNHFRDVPPLGNSELEVIRIGSENLHSQTDAGVVIDNNLFERIKGNGELISVQSSGNVIRDNTFRDFGESGVRFRIGNDNRFSGNTLINGRYGIMVSGLRNEITDNTFIDCSRLGVALLAGHRGRDGVPDPITGLAAADGAVVEGNRFHNSGEESADEIGIDLFLGEFRFGGRVTEEVRDHIVADNATINDPATVLASAYTVSSPDVGPQHRP